MHLAAFIDGSRIKNGFCLPSVFRIGFRMDYPQTAPVSNRCFLLLFPGLLVPYPLCFLSSSYIADAFGDFGAFFVSTAGAAGGVVFAMGNIL